MQSDEIDLTSEESEVLYAAIDTLDELRHTPCVECGETGDTMPCIVCNKMVCDDCGFDLRWCKEHRVDAEVMFDRLAKETP